MKKTRDFLPDSKCPKGYEQEILNMKKTKILIGLIGVLILIIAFFIFRNSMTGKFIAINDFKGDIKIYKSSSCGCCEVYVNYFKSKGNSNIEIINLQDVNSIKEKYGVPEELQSCHTTIVENYFVEGHIPLEAVEKLLEEKPDIAGIAMSGMPSGSPGMLGAKTGDFVIYAVEHNGKYREFMRI